MSKHIIDNLIRLWAIVVAYLLLATFGGQTLAAGPSEFEMPFNLSMAPDTRVVDVGQYAVGDIQEANGSLATKDTARSVLRFYERELEAAGFEIFSKTDNDSRVSFAAKRADGGYFSLSSSTRSYLDVEEGETELRIIFRYVP
ncbi:MAG: hypothetical protein ABJ000_05000 [Saccharospirillum sp.]|uniref:hypothetical protein n=1 Tax=Saccharospirillum sp. TaxID=2033801 RepID=UPI00329720EA